MAFKVQSVQIPSQSSGGGGIDLVVTTAPLATVTLSNETFNKSLTSDDSGVCTFLALENGTYTLLSQKGTMNSSREVVISNQENINIPLSYIHNFDGQLEYIVFPYSVGLDSVELNLTGMLASYACTFGYNTTYPSKFVFSNVLKTYSSTAVSDILQIDNNVVTLGFNSGNSTTATGSANGTLKLNFKSDYVIPEITMTSLPKCLAGTSTSDRLRGWVTIPFLTPITTTNTVLSFRGCNGIAESVGDSAYIQIRTYHSDGSYDQKQVTIYNGRDWWQERTVTISGEDISCIKIGNEVYAALDSLSIQFNDAHY